MLLSTSVHSSGTSQFHTRRTHVDLMILTSDLFTLKQHNSLQLQNLLNKYETR